MRIIKLLKVMKSKKRTAGATESTVKIDGGTERLSFVSLIFCFACHIFACMWLLLGA